MVKSDVAQLDRIFSALADSTRRAVLTTVSKKGNTVGEIAKPFHMPPVVVLKHLQVLETKNLIACRRAGSFQLVMLNEQAL
jgi:predicted transcriptional regulator